MRDDLRRLGGGEGKCAEVTAFSTGGSSGQDGGVAMSLKLWLAGQTGAGGVTQRGVLDRGRAEAEMASPISGSKGGG